MSKLIQLESRPIDDPEEILQTQQVPEQPDIDASQPGPSSATPLTSFRAPILGSNSQRSMTDFVQINKPLTVPRKKVIDEQLAKMIVKK